MRRVERSDVPGWWWAKVRDVAHPDIAWDWTPMDLRSERSFAYYSAGENARQCDWCGPIPTPEQSAAVDMLKALKFILPALDNQPPPQLGETNWPLLAEEARAAIAKAECGPIPTPDEVVDVEALAEQVVRFLTPPEDGLDEMDVIAVGSMINRVLREKGAR